jgi:hypothetical protein
MIALTPCFLFAGQAALPDTSVLAISLVGVAIALVLDLYCINYCLRDLSRRVMVSVGNKQLWAMIIVLGGPVGQVVYWLYGRGPY